MYHILQTVDEHWKISCETAIKARSVTGYATCNRKMILNKFLEGDPKVCSGLLRDCEIFAKVLLKLVLI